MWYFFWDDVGSILCYQNWSYRCVRHVRAGPVKSAGSLRFPPANGTATGRQDCRFGAVINAASDLACGLGCVT
ncbi:hypothetical protein J6590_023675 [Homalodisca vitripennis]|nr:hypothetical protein J6590_023675 [Homalodisca vitripennis]